MCVLGRLFLFYCDFFSDGGGCRVLIAMHFFYLFIYFFGGIRAFDVFGIVTLCYFWSCLVYYLMFDHNRHIVKWIDWDRTRARRVKCKQDKKAHSIQVMSNRCYSFRTGRLWLVWHVNNNNDSTCTNTLFVFVRLCGWGVQLVCAYEIDNNNNIISKFSLCDIIIKVDSMCVSLN